ncbi:Anaerobic sulfite reductase subunit A [bacterium HR12]|nr:Anaerobic sulfite reductase subunit A [bacterium HR12]
MWYLERDGLGRLIGLLAERGYRVIGPTVRDGAVVLDEVTGLADLPAGVREVQGPGRYRLERTDDGRLFDWAHGPDAGKRFLFPPRERLTEIRRGREGMRAEPAPEEDDRPLALLGLRSCDLHAIAVQDRVFLELDERYRRRRERAVLIGVNCAVPGSTCFCVSMGTGPRCTAGFDLALTELAEGFALEVGSRLGAELRDALGVRAATDGERAEVEAIARAAAERMGRSLDVADMPGLLYRNREHPRWGDVGARCLACANCTMVCPTCFCHDVVDDVSLSGETATRTREWASCFSAEYSWAAGAVVRESHAARYLQWLTHKFASWIDQFGVSGCVGCGRCITWCPVGIDVTEEIAAIRASDGAVEVRTA